MDYSSKTTAAIILYREIFVPILGDDGDSNVLNVSMKIKISKNLKNLINLKDSNFKKYLNNLPFVNSWKMFIYTSINCTFNLTENLFLLDFNNWVKKNKIHLSINEFKMIENIKY